jgi:magnesium-transporting ATPase (P-type)
VFKMLVTGALGETLSFLFIGITLLICPWAIALLASAAASRTSGGKLQPLKRQMYFAMWIISILGILGGIYIGEGHFSTLLESFYLVVSFLSTMVSCILLVIALESERPQIQRH